MTSDQQQIQLVFSQFIDAVKNKDIDKLLEVTYPRQFEIIQREEFREYLEFYYSEQVVSFGTDSLISISEIQYENDIKYSIVTHKTQYLMDFSIYKDNREPAIELSKQIIPDLKQQFGDENVYFDLNTLQIKIDLESKELFIFDPKIKTWKIINRQYNDTNIYEQFIPERFKYIFKL